MKHKRPDPSTRSLSGHALFYTRDSGGGHEQTLQEYVEWARRKSAELGLSFDGSPETILQMARLGEIRRGDLFLDWDVKGDLLDRRALNELREAVARDMTVSHVFIPKRERLARPDDPVDAIQIENELRRLGVHLVYMDKVLAPIKTKRRPDIAEQIVALCEFKQSGQFLEDLAVKIIYAQIRNAKAGYSTGGRPPFGFRRWLCHENGSPVRELASGEVVRLSGHHVIWLPGPQDELNLIVRILSMLETMPASRVARVLNEEGVPSPDAGRSRKDNGVTHKVSGRWNQTTIKGIATNTLCLALKTYGRRAMGNHMRATPSGPRQLDDADVAGESRSRVVQNAPKDQIVAPAKFAPVIEQSRFESLQATLAARAGSQHGKPKGQGRQTPLDARVVDLACTWPMYRVPYNGRHHYKCGLYQQTQGAQCSHNHVDVDRSTRFVLATIWQQLFASGKLKLIEERIQKLAHADGEHDTDPAVQQKAALADVQAKLDRVRANLALAENETQFKAISVVFDELVAKESRLVNEIASVGQPSSPHDPELAAEQALTLLRRLPTLAGDPKNLDGIRELFQRLNVGLYLRFQPVQKKVRVENKLQCGILTMGDVPPPIQRYTGATTRSALSETAGEESQKAAQKTTFTGREEKSLGNVSRGDWI